MKRVVTEVTYAGERILVTSQIEGCAANIVDVAADQQEELDTAIALALRATRKQLLQLINTGGCT